MSNDQFSLWLNIRHLFDDLNKDTLKFKQDEIISFFGGFRSMIKLCLNNKFNLDTFTSQQLFKLLTSYKNEQKNKILKTKPIITKNQLQVAPKHGKLLLLDIHEISISIVFTYLNQYDHISFQKSCKLLTIIGRRKHSFTTHHTNYLQCVHKLSYVFDCINQRNRNFTNFTKVDNGMKMFKSIKVKDYDNANVVTQSGIISFVFNACKLYMNRNNYYIISCDIHDIIFLVHKHLISLLKSDGFVSRGLKPMFQFILAFFSNIKFYCRHSSCFSKHFIKTCANIILKVLKYDHSYVIILNRMDFAMVLWNAYSILSHRYSFVTVKQLFSNIIKKLLRCVCFDFNKNSNMVYELIQVELFHCIKQCIVLQTAQKKSHIIKLMRCVTMCNNKELRNICRKIKTIRFADFASFVFPFFRESKEFGSWMYDQLNCYPKETLQFICQTMKSVQFGSEFKSVIMDNPCKIYKCIINASYNYTIFDGINCCLCLSFEYFDQLIASGIIYVFQDFIFQFNWFCKRMHKQSDKDKLCDLLFDVITILNEYIDNKIVSMQLSLDWSVKKCILTDINLPKELIQLIVSSKIWSLKNKSQINDMSGREYVQENHNTN